MATPSKDAYDAVIIGAGISGLVCGCYLAKAGLKVLIAEQHHKPGGYCTSFRRGRFTFDAAAHCFGGYRKEGITRKAFTDLGIDGKVNITKSDPSDTVITPDHTVSFWSDIQQTVEGFRAVFPEERESIKKFFQFLLNPDPHSFSRMRSWTFQNLLDQYFANDRIKTLLAAPLLGLGGLPPSRMSAFIGSKLVSEFLLDGGYHPDSGMQALPDALSERFKELGGELRLSCLVTKIREKEGEVKGVMIGKGDLLPSRYVISNCDARQTFLTLLGKNKIQEELRGKLASMEPSTSMFIAYLGLDGQSRFFPRPGTNIWFLSHYDLDKAYGAAREGDVDGFGGYMLRLSQDRSTLIALVPAPYKTKRYWLANKKKALECIIKKIENNSIPQLTNCIKYKTAATPQTLRRYTLNYHGASFGWAGTPSQLAVSGFKKPSFVKNLYLTGHWTTQGLGISGVTYVGYDTAQIILRKEKGKIIYSHG
jgi:prolycopene isomerase